MRPITAALVVAVLAAGGVAAGTAGAHGNPGPPLPPIPTIPKPPTKIPGETVATFKLVFEGTWHADRIVDVGGPVGECMAQLHEDIQEDGTFGRGKGVTMKFIKRQVGSKVEYGFERAGTPGSSKFTVVGTIKRTTSGSADIIQGPQGACQDLQHYDLSQNPDCGKPVTDRADWGLKMEGPTYFAPRPGVVSQFSVDRCGEPPTGSAFGSSIADMTWAWPTLKEFISEPIPFAKMFNKRYKAFAVQFGTLEGSFPFRDGVGIVETGHDTGHATATVRFIRE